MSGALPGYCLGFEPGQRRERHAVRVVDGFDSRTNPWVTRSPRLLCSISRYLKIIYVRCKYRSSPRQRANTTGHCLGYHPTVFTGYWSPVGLSGALTSLTCSRRPPLPTVAYQQPVCFRNYTFCMADPWRGTSAVPQGSAYRRPPVAAWGSSLLRSGTLGWCTPFPNSSRAGRIRTCDLLSRTTRSTPSSPAGLLSAASVTRPRRW